MEVTKSQKQESRDFSRERFKSILHITLERDKIFNKYYDFVKSELSGN